MSAISRYLSRFAHTRFYRENSRLFAGITLFVWCWFLMYGFLFYHPSYTAETMVMIKDSAISAGYIEPEQIYSSKTTSSNASNPVLNTMGLLKSKAISQDLFDYLNQHHPKELKKRGIKTQQDWTHFFQDGSSFIKAKNKTGTDLITITFKWTDPVIAKEGTEVVLESFKRASLELNQVEQRSRRKYLAHQVKEVNAKLEKIRHQKSDYKIENKTVDASRESSELTKLRNTFRARLNHLIAQAEGKNAEVGRYQDMLGMTPEQAIEASALGMNTTLSRLKNELYTLSETEALLSTTLTDKNPKLKEIRARKSQVEADIRHEISQTLGYETDFDRSLAVSDEPRSKVTNQLVSAQAEMIRLEQEAHALRSRLVEIDRQIEAFPEVEEALANIDQKERSLSDSLDALRKKYLEAELKEAQTLSNVFVVDPPVIPKNANFPTPLHLTLIGFLMGIGAGIAAVVIRYKYRLESRLTYWINQTLLALETKMEMELKESEPFLLHQAVQHTEDQATDTLLETLFEQSASETSQKALNIKWSRLHQLTHQLERYQQALNKRKVLLEKKEKQIQASQEIQQTYPLSLQSDNRSNELPAANHHEIHEKTRLLPDEIALKQRIRARYLSTRNVKTSQDMTKTLRALS